MKILIALGGNALLRRGEEPKAEVQEENIREGVEKISKVIKENEIILVHGNGPQVGLLALQSESYKKVETYPFDILVAETEGMIGYMLQKELNNELKGKREVVTVITQVEVDGEDEAFKNATKPIGEVYSKEEAEKKKREKGWNIMEDGKYYRRAIASPKPKKVIEIETIKKLLKNKVVTICGGGGGVPIKREEGKIVGVEAVIDKDLCASLIGRELDFDIFIIATDVDGVYLNWGKENEKKLGKVKVEEMKKYNFSKGSMGPKVDACIQFTEYTGKRSVIGSLSRIEGLLSGEEGTQIIK